MANILCPRCGDPVGPTVLKSDTEDQYDVGPCDNCFDRLLTRPKQWFIATYPSFRFEPVNIHPESPLATSTLAKEHEPFEDGFGHVYMWQYVDCDEQ